MVLLVVFAQEADVLRFGEVLAQEVGGAGLQGFLVLHHGFNTQRFEGAGEAFVFGLGALDDGHGHDGLGEVGVDAVHLFGFFNRFGFGGVGGVAFLPEELGGAQEQARAEFPAHDVGPLVDQQRQVAVALDPFGEAGADDGFAGGADDEGFVQLAGGFEAAFAVVFKAVVGDDGALFGEAFDVLGFFLEVALGDEEGEVGVFVAGVFEAAVEVGLHELPDGVAPGLDDHAAADVGVFGEVGGADDLLVPLGVVFGAGGGDCRSSSICFVAWP